MPDFTPKDIGELVLIVGAILYALIVAFKE